MSIKLEKLNDQEIKSFMERVFKDTKFQSITLELQKRKWLEEFKYSIKTAQRVITPENTVVNVTVSFDGERTDITITEIDNLFSYDLHYMFDKDGEKYIKYIHVENGNFGEHVDLKYSSFLRSLDGLDKRAEEMQKNDVSTDGIPIYGNWCGPGYGSGTPIDGMDYCCKLHDNCYGSQCYSSCFCNGGLISCLQPYRPHWFAVAAILYFTFASCDNCPYNPPEPIG